MKGSARTVQVSQLNASNPPTSKTSSSSSLVDADAEEVAQPIAALSPLSFFLREKMMEKVYSGSTPKICGVDAACPVSLDRSRWGDAMVTSDSLCVMRCGSGYVPRRLDTHTQTLHMLREETRERRPRITVNLRRGGKWCPRWGEWSWCRECKINVACVVLC